MLGTAAAVSGALATRQTAAQSADATEEEIKVGKRIRRVAKNGRIKHSIVAWCFREWYILVCVSLYMYFNDVIKSR